jgi:NhaA family Na+:H+ antiporter
MKKTLRILFENSFFLIAGAAAALIWANIDAEGYGHFIHLKIAGKLSLQHLVNDVFMAVFFAIAAKEVWEAILPGGPLSNFRKAAMPLIATVGGMAGPAILFLIGVFALGATELTRGWAVPTATDIAFSYLVARLIFGAGHPAIPFLLLLAIADDAGGLIILAVAYPNPDVELAPIWLLATVGAIVLGFGMRKLKLQSFWWYLLGPGVLSWYSFHAAGLHPALGLVPIIPTLPHAHTDLGLYARDELKRNDTLNEFEHWWKNPVEIFLGCFGLVNAGVEFSSMAAGTWLVLAGLVIGKPLGITLFAWLGEKVFKLELPAGMNYRQVVVLGCIAGIGFTVALFVSTAAFPKGETLDAVKMGALFSFGATFVSFGAAKLLGVGKLPPNPPATPTVPPAEQAEDEFVGSAKSSE